MKHMSSIIGVGLTLCLAASSAGAQAQARPATAAAPAQPAAPGFKDEFLGQFNYSMERFIQLAEAMPADKFAWSPGTGTMTVAKVYAHVAHYNYRYPATPMAIAAPAALRLDTLEQVADKASVVALLKSSAAHVQKAVKDMPDAQLGRRTQLYGRDVAQWAVL